MRFLNSKRVLTADANNETTHHWVRLFAYSRANGTPIPANDLWIAALAMPYSVLLLSGDKHFEKLPQIALYA